MQVADIMTRRLATVPPEAGLRAAVGIMLDHGVGSILVVDEVLVGIITRSDVLRAIHHEQAALADLSVTAAMTEEVITVKPTQSVSSGLRLMDDHGIRKLPVRDGLDIVGILTLTDIARHHPHLVRQVRGAADRREEWTH